MTQTSQYDFWVKLASRASVATALTLIIIKLLAWLYSGSASMLASLTDSFADALASIVNFLLFVTQSFLPIRITDMVMEKQSP
ncbi:iron transporter cation diffusion facilitator family transporter [Shewanella putrefaciens]|nr:iron transporter cation diffusion facilitator family transporter [Shewanella putrefaciens]